ncbi:hypothetical protein J2S49_001593 [Arcanobacterium wilhelmae]|uniref:Uncharacterized protein n=1 Tax=Arcanobacterium wilhelmae TaxID=1803177 RepID=A0ABT9NCS1_9ACTO|nr:hypothetical protein [Arcanobacterium wilhelmae]MDP9801517.1 hypothetical protein [Arcanobacterium wilhelmae]
MASFYDRVTARLVFHTMGLENACELSYQLRTFPPAGDGSWVHSELLAWLEEESAHPITCTDDQLE